jgi:hypothetical protein
MTEEEEGEYALIPDERPIISENELKMFEVICYFEC